jgi:hypothetical protein
MDAEMQEIMRQHREDVASHGRVMQTLAHMREYLRRQQTDEHTALSLERAICHPLLGGILRRDARGDVPGPSFTTNSLRLAAKKGDLETLWHGRLQFVTPAALKAWLTRKPDGSAAPVPVVPNTPPSISSAVPTLYEKRQGSASVAMALAALDAKPSTLTIRKKRR